VYQYSEEHGIQVFDILEVRFYKQTKCGPFVGCLVSENITSTEYYVNIRGSAL
jgi:hypothetical protein